MYKVLIVDDERMIREGMKKVIPWHELEIGEVWTAASGKEALALTCEKVPDIMITDISMAEMNGLELIENIQEAAPNMRILVLTGYDYFEYARECLRLSVQDFLLKPIDEEVLSEAVKRQVVWLKEREVSNMRRRTEGVASQMELEQVMNDLVHERQQKNARAQALRFVQEHFRFRYDTGLTAVVLQPEMDFTVNEQDRMLRRQQIKSICLEFIDAKGLGITFDDEEDGQTILVLSDRQCGSDTQDVIASLQDILKVEFGSSPKAAIGSKVDGFEHLAISYREAVYLLKNDEADICPILQTQNDIRRNRLFQEVYEEMKMQMCTNIGDYAYVMRIFDSFRITTQSYNLSGASVCRFCFELLADLSYAYLAAGGTVKSPALDHLMRAVHGCGGAECLELGRQYLAKMLDFGERDVHEIVAKAKRYISEHLSEDLSVGSIAESLFVSPNYFSRLFKRVAGQGCNEYIVCRRIEKACVLLETTNFNTGKIAGMVGYHDTNYFSQTKKKHCGVSPTSYRSGSRKAP